MSRPTREAIFLALFAKMQTISGIVMSSRRLQNVQDMDPVSLPAGFQLQGKQSIKYKGSVPAANDWYASWIFYGYSADPSIAPSTSLNNIIDAACTILQPPVENNRQTLGGLVEYAAVEGDIEIFEGVLGDRAVAILPIRIILAGF